MIHFSSAFNTFLPDKLKMTLKDQGTPEAICRFVWDFLSNRLQYVKMPDKRSSSITINIGSPQGCVLLAYLFSLYTNSGKCMTECCPHSNILVLY